MEKTLINPKNLMSINDFAKLKGVTRQTVYNWIEDKKVQKIEFLTKQFIDKSTFKS